MRLSPIVAGSVVALAAGFAHADEGAITVTLDASTDPAGFYRLVGQSVFFQVHDGGFTTGGQLDNTQTPGNVITFPELFPPDDLEDYLGFGYFGVIQTVTVDNDLNETVVDESLIVAFDGGAGQDDFEDLFPGFDEDTIVNALRTSFDSAEFTALLAEVDDRPDTVGVTTVLEIGRLGEVMDLVAFIGEDNGSGDTGVDVGDFGFAVTSIPEPASALLLAAGGLLAIPRRVRR